MTPETSARQCWHWLAATSRRWVGFGCNGRCAPACGLAFGFASATPLALCPCEGGVLELSGVFGGKSSLTHSFVLLPLRLRRVSNYRYCTIATYTACSGAKPTSAVKQHFLNFRPLPH